jgi:hypothetical protein
VTGLESVERWLEIGSAAIATDFVGMKDLIDMSRDIIPGAFVAGLPRSDELPGLSVDTGVATDLLRRAVFRKDVVTAGTDRWIAFPTPQIAVFGDRIPVVGLGVPTPSDFMLLGAPKYASLFAAAALAQSADVDSDIIVPGTDFQMQNTFDISITDIRSIFGSNAVLDEAVQVAPLGVVQGSLGAWDVNVAATIRANALEDPIRMMHAWERLRYADREAWNATWSRVIEENAYSYIMYVDPQDLGENYADFLAMSFGVPYIK